MTCEFCQHDGGELLWRDARCRVVYVDEAGYPGFCRVIWADHVEEMTDLSDTARDQLMRVVFAVEATLREVMRPHKINLASLGNMTPHLHWHVISRFEQDPHYPNPIWGERVRPAVATGGPQLAGALRTALMRRLGPTQGSTQNGKM